jgi:predicted Co/Zn/Cd cation transporter (cation efflux family)
MPQMSANSRRPLAPGEELAVLVFALLTLVALMVASYYFPYPSGKPPNPVSFILFWLREALILVFAAIILLVIVFLAVIRQFQRLLKGKRDAP